MNDHDPIEQAIERLAEYVPVHEALPRVGKYWDALAELRVRSNRADSPVIAVQIAAGVLGLTTCQVVEAIAIASERGVLRHQVPRSIRARAFCRVDDLAHSLIFQAPRSWSEIRQPSHWLVFRLRREILHAPTSHARTACIAFGIDRRVLRWFERDHPIPDGAPPEHVSRSAIEQARDAMALIASPPEPLMRQVADLRRRRVRWRTIARETGVHPDVLMSAYRRARTSMETVARISSQPTISARRYNRGTVCRHLRKNGLHVSPGELRPTTSSSYFQRIPNEHYRCAANGHDVGQEYVIDVCLTNWAKFCPFKEEYEQRVAS